MSMTIIILNETDAKNNSSPSKYSSDSKHWLNLVESLALSLTSLISKHLDARTGSTNYLSLHESGEFSGFKSTSSELVYCNLLLLNDEERKCFFINVYNVLTIHAIAYCTVNNDGTGAISSVLQIPDFWRRYGYRIGDYFYSLDDIEHGILRGNREHPTSHVIQFCDGDPRINLTLTTCDARIHFALNCGAKSCPMVRVYSPKSLNDKLDMVTKSYLSQEIQMKQLEDEKVKILIPQIFEWYGNDFASSVEDLLRWILSFLEGCTHHAIEDILRSGGNLSDRIEYGYNWSLS